MPKMYEKFREAKLNEKTGNLMTPAGRFIYADFFEPRLPKREKDPKKARYGVVILFPKAADVSALVEYTEETRDEKWTKKAQSKMDIAMPVLRTKDIARLREFADEYPYCLRTKSRNKPQVRGPRGKGDDITEDMADDEVYNGRWGRCSVDAFAYDVDGTSYGVSCGLQNVQLLDHDEVLVGGRASADDEFESASDEEIGDADDDI